MIFEGSEKKFEIVVSGIDLRTMQRSFWEAVVAKSHATILSSVSNKHVDAYLLSESSLFVWPDRVTMLTCGTTTLVDALIHTVEKFGRENIELLVFQRKNEHFSDMQNTTFYDDIEKLKSLFPRGLAWRFGSMHEHHNFVFHSEGPYQPEKTDITSELLMYDIQGPACQVLIDPAQTKESVRDFFDLKSLLKDFDVDDFVFDPYGYSLNAIKDDFYCTIHVTPQEVSSYVSFETNLPLGEQIQGIFVGLIEKLRPRSFDTVTFNCDMKDFMPSQYNRKTVVSKALEIGYDVTFCHYFMEADNYEKPYRIL